MTISSVQNMLISMQDMELKAKGVDSHPVGQTSGVGQFGSMLSNFIEDVNTVKVSSEKLQDSYTRGEPGVSLQQMMMATQQANIQLNFLTEVRNKVLNAYDEISRMGL